MYDRASNPAAEHHGCRREALTGAPPAPITVVILTLDEAVNVSQALDSVCGWAERVFVLDSGSTDGTDAIARRYGCDVFHHAFAGYARQRNYALEHLPFATDWVFFLDADEFVTPELKTELSALLAAGRPEHGFFVKRRLIWMGRWIRRGCYPTWILRVFRRSHGRYGDRPVNEHVVVDGAVGYLEHDLIHADHKGLSDWTQKHVRYAEYEARELLRDRTGDRDVTPRLLGDQVARKRWLRIHLWERLPPLVRPFLYFTYRYVVRGGFLDGREGFIYHVLQALWFPLIVDVRYIEIKSGWR